MADDVTVTIRVPRDLKTSVQAISSELGISQSAVWKILLMRSLKPAAEGGARGVVEGVTLRIAEGSAPARTGARPPAARP